MRTDWLALQAYIIAFNTTGSDGAVVNPWRRELSKQIREVFESATVKLSDRAMETGFLDN